VGEMTPITDVQRLYKQWQEGKLLDNEERVALSVPDVLNNPKQTFSDFLKAASDPEPASYPELLPPSFGTLISYLPMLAVDAACLQGVSSTKRQVIPPPTTSLHRRKRAWLIRSADLDPVHPRRSEAGKQ
jgi:hypothetical protein